MNSTLSKLAETRSSDVVLSGDAPLPSILRASILRLLEQSLPGGVSIATAATLCRVRDSLQSPTFGAAVRLMDHAWRCRPDDAGMLAPVYARLLMLEERDFEAALRLLGRAIDVGPDPEIAALIALARLRLQHTEHARRQLEATLAAYSLTPGGVVFQVAGEVMRHPAIAAPGWIGRGPDLEFVGEISSIVPCDALEFRREGQPPVRQLLTESAFRIDYSKAGIDTVFECSHRGLPLLGSGCRGPPDFGLDGRASSCGRRLTGWARLGWSPTQPPRLRIEDQLGHRTTVRTQLRPQSGGRWAFNVNLRRTGLRDSRLWISARVPDGRWLPLPDSPLLLKPATRLRRRAAQASEQPDDASGLRVVHTLTQRAGHTNVIIPVYRGREQTLGCIDAVLLTLDGETSVVVVDDATDDPELAAALDVLAAQERITLLRNAVNQGFVTAVNRAWALHPQHDAVLLNSDTLVFDDWLPRLRAAAYSSAAVGTATPLSNYGSIASYPRSKDSGIDPADGVALHALAVSTHSGRRAEIPVGVGFCLYVRRDCLRDVGDLDAAVFGKGYGEEVDFCMRARRRGWTHILAADVFVYHAGGLSFGSRRPALLDRSQRLLNLRYPGYDRLIARFLARDSLHVLRRGLDERRVAAFQGRFVLLVTLALAGGVERFVAERCRDLRTQGLYPLVLKAATAGTTARCELWTDALDAPNLRYDIPSELHALATLLSGLRLWGIEIQHFLHLDARVVDVVRALEIPYDVVIHDYAWICPRITLIDGTGRYCGEPDVAACEACVRRNGTLLGRAISVAALRKRSAAWLGGARRVIAPSADTARRLLRYFPDLKVQVQPHTAPNLPAPKAPPTHAASMRVVLIGAIGEHKGYQVLLACARDARARALPIEFIVVGYTENDAPLLETGKVFITGRYADGEATHLLERERPDVAWLPSVWPETWSYTLDHALAAGLPVVAFDLGAIAERLRASGLGDLLPLDSAPESINDHLVHLHAHSRSSRPPEMSMSPLNDAKPEVIHEDGLSASVQVLAFQAGMYMFTLKAGGSPMTGAVGEMALPAMHVGMGPGMLPEQVEFLAGPSTHGAWLSAPADLLVIKVNVNDTILVLTSVRAPDGAVLSLKVQRLKSDADAAGGTLAPSTPMAEQRKPELHSPSREGSLAVQIVAHIQTRGDVCFIDAAWAGRLTPGLWIESFSVLPLKGLTAADIEYRGLTGSGFETPWQSDATMCGTKGMAVPLVGFAMRLKPGPATSAYDCEYSGYFQSGLTVGPRRDGSPCRSNVANDPLEGIQVRLINKSATAAKGMSGPDGIPSDAVPGLAQNSTTNGVRAVQISSLRGRAAVDV